MKFDSFLDAGRGAIFLVIGVLAFAIGQVNDVQFLKGAGIVAGLIGVLAIVGHLVGSRDEESGPES